METNTAFKAKTELDILAQTAPDAILTPFAEEVLALCEKFGKSGQSGGSAPFTATVIANSIKKLLLQENICPITGIDDEWIDHTAVSDGQQLFQNKRAYAVFKDSPTGKSWYLDAVIFKDQHGITHSVNSGVLLADGSKIKSRQYIKSFPFEPKTFYIDVIEKEVAKDDLEYEIKDENQLKKVWKVYERM